MKTVVKALLLVMPAIGFVVPSVGAGILQEEGILAPFGGNSSCAQGATHIIYNPCTGAFTEVSFLSSIFDCRHVFVEGPDVGISPPHCSMIDPTTINLVLPSCLVQVRDVSMRRVSGELRVYWRPFGCAGNFDVIRGTVSALESASVGDVICLADDRPPPYAADLTGEDPPPGEAFFYLVRPNGPAGFEHYGYSSSESQRTPASGDCPTE